MDQVLGDGNERYSSYCEGTEMQPSFSQHSWESAWDSSPQSYESSFLNNHSFSQNGLNASPVTPPAVPFDASPTFGNWVEEPDFENLPMMFSEQEFSFDTQSMFHPAPEMGYSQDETVLAGSYGSTGGYDAPIEATQEASSSYICPPPNAPVQRLTKNSTKPGYHCDIPGCESKTRFTRKTDLQRHVKSLHHVVKFDCKYSWCGRSAENGFVRKDHYLEHLREMHRKDIPKINRRRSKH
jgi:hypothetical protein